MKKGCLWFLLPLVLLLTGCPHNEYIVKLTPHGDKIHRKLIFYRGETDTNGAVKYEEFPQEELDAIMAIYPNGLVTNNGATHVKGDFAESMPSDVGGAGAYSNLTTTLGSAGFYAERFRGDDDLAGQTEKRLAAASQLVDILIGWSKAELGAETNYAQLRRFLDGQFRKDVKNAVFYFRDAQEKSAADTNADTEYEVRFALYLVEHGYFKLGDVPALFRILGENDETDLIGFIQRLVARKLGVADSQPVPATLAFLKDTSAMETSFSNYFVGTDFYKNKIKERASDTNSPKNKPDAWGMVAEEILSTMFDFDFFGVPSDHLQVALSLPVPPTRCNGKWDETNKYVRWDSSLEGKTNSVNLPVLCYANWAQPEESFQKQHFGRVILIGDDLAAYCIWHASLMEKHAMEWEKFLAGLQPGDTLKQKIEDFRFSDEAPTAEKKDEERSPSYLGRGSIGNALDGKSLQGGPSDASRVN